MSGGGIIPRGGGYSKRRGRGRRGGGNGGFRDDIRDNQSDRHLSPDRRSNHSEDRHEHRFNNYRQQNRPNSRTPSPSNHNQVQTYRNNPFDARPALSSNDRDQGRNRFSPPSFRRDGRDSDRNGYHEKEEEPTRGSRNDLRTILKPTDKEAARTWKLRIADAEEAIRRAEFQLRRAKMDHEALLEAYKEYTETTCPQELLKPNW
ncbi:NAM-associated domain-containing protein [Caenorhabditis elegans]|uniref:NAM-associated domain-containing protein n=1 Tax=Caenorhabditis elegans TaxID=6239 RepID=O18036_CAEEL|nr:NAM-associated domain-containing protein [Caenorhabditis elegans]CAB04691.1 NAM-associated domain-containing protein [Caenorhabditis elegans]|eukprot:NP_492558.1 Uncharacterized protein CELE_T05F1.4 [Caenorhabditis elegans]